ncbi:adenylate/guanylate cyclase domain-containing protein, partial [candidate division WOR-3 bacterium]
RIRREERIRDRLYRFFSPAVVETIIKGGHRLGGVQVEATILFADIRGFTPMVEDLRPDYTVELLNQFLSAMTEEVFKEDGTLDKYIGDCVMAVFGAPIAHPDDPLRAIRTGLGMKERVKEINESWRERGFFEELKIGIGINTGKVLAGNIGSEKRMDYTVISDAVNLASRLEGVAEPDQIIISEATYLRVKDRVRANRLEPVRVQGKREPVPIYEVIGLK